MVGRSTVSILLVLCLQSLDRLYAQHQPHALSHGATNQYHQPAVQYHQPAAFGALPIERSSNSRQMLPGHPVNHDPRMIVPPGNWSALSGRSPMLAEQLPEDQGGAYGDSPLDVYLKQVAENSWVRLEFLKWNLKRPGEHKLGTDVAGIIDPTELFPVSVGNFQAGFAKVEDLGGISLRDSQGIRATLGIPLTSGAIEANIYAFQENNDTKATGGLGPPPVGEPFNAQVFVATSTFTNGQLGSNLFLYDRSFDVKFSSDLWGAEANYIAESLRTGEGLHLRPMLGFQFFELDERLIQVGAFDQSGFLAPPLVSTIDSLSTNRVFAPQFGLRLEFVHRWFTLTAEPKLGLGVNVFRTRVIADKIRSFGDPTVITTQTDEKFAPLGDFDFRAHVNVNEYFSLFFGYDVLVAAKIVRPQDSIFYNDNGPAADTDITAKAGFQNMMFQGISFGGELRFR